MLFPWLSLASVFGISTTVVLMLFSGFEEGAFVLNVSWFISFLEVVGIVVSLLWEFVVCSLISFEEVVCLISSWVEVEGCPWLSFIEVVSISCSAGGFTFSVKGGISLLYSVLSLIEVGMEVFSLLSTADVSEVVPCSSLSWVNLEVSFSIFSEFCVGILCSVFSMREEVLINDSDLSTIDVFIDTCSVFSLRLVEDTILVVPFVIGSWVIFAEECETYSVFTILLVGPYGLMVGSWGSTFEVGSWGSTFEVGSWDSSLDVGSWGSTLDVGSWGSTLDVGSWGSTFEVGSCGSTLDVGSWGSTLDVGSWGSTFEVGSCGSTFEVGCCGSTFEVGSWG